jgi:hypothetical protein
MSDFSFMRSGFDNVQDAVDEEEMKKNVVSIIVKFAEGAMKTAAKYVNHSSERNMVLPEDLKRAMMLEMFLFKHRNNLLQDVETLKNELFSENEYDEISDLGYDPDSDEDGEIEFTENDCTCSICRTINNIYENWETLNINSPYEALLKQHIENMC